MKSDLRSQIFVAVSAAITQKYPTQTTIDYAYIADTALKLTNTLYDKYNEDNKVKPELLNEQEAHINDQIRIPLAEEPNWT